MKRTARQATWAAYLGVICVLVGMSPAGADLMDRVPVLHAVWHLWLFIGAALMVYGLETLRWLTRRHRRTAA
ncbi:hypothetical protein GCM10010885_21080 [Alicyclobacillus cellulosilyticus]|uniref:Uncharacterized protein n=1 Tax=Alicyclobacillus cellulosilyticus TaxID=1003997 RepID=A0A917KFT0_9BACL|nr:hypothetical protein [Alicyclobacillus cellulosilyticus]GGJ11543.1 hypothetical protein GCM10010885_21080 [Alicyclobacillus cellulosilyticus]